MKKNEVKIGGCYIAKVSNKLAPVRIDSTNTHGGWNATNTRTGKRIRIKSAQRLRGAAKDAAKAEASETPKDAVAKDAKKTVNPKATAEKTLKHISALDAAAQVLSKASKPMRAKELITAMAEQNLWKSPGGATPHSTLYAAMQREEREKGGDSRFRKIDRGLFTFNAEAK